MLVILHRPLSGLIVSGGEGGVVSHPPRMPYSLLTSPESFVAGC